MHCTCRIVLQVKFLCMKILSKIVIKEAHGYPFFPPLKTGGNMGWWFARWHQDPKNPERNRFKNPLPVGRKAVSESLSHWTETEMTENEWGEEVVLWASMAEVGRCKGPPPCPVLRCSSVGQRARSVAHSQLIKAPTPLHCTPLH